MISNDQIIQYFGQPPYFRNIKTGNVELLPHRIRLSNGKTLTDPSQWSKDPQVLAEVGYIETEITQIDLDQRIKPVTFEEIKEQYLNNLDFIWKQKIKDGWQTPFGWKLGLDISDVTLLTGAFILLKESVSLGFNNEIEIIDLYGESHSVDLDVFTQIMLSYGQYRSYLSKQDAKIRLKIINANNKEELELAMIELSEEE
jgi:hypothetical protein